MYPVILQDISSNKDCDPIAVYLGDLKYIRVKPRTAADLLITPPTDLDLNAIAQRPDIQSGTISQRCASFGVFLL